VLDKCNLSMSLTQISVRNCSSRIC